MEQYVIRFEKLSMNDIDIVGGKNASLGEMISNLAASGVSVPRGFATTAQAFREFLKHNDLEHRISNGLNEIDVDDVKSLAAAGARIRDMVVQAEFPRALETAVRSAHETLCGDNRETAVAVRSSATAEDLPDASFAGQQETYLNVCGIDTVLTRIKDVFASLYNDRAISYRVHHGFEHSGVALSAGVQRMVRSDIGAAGVMFTLDTESGFPGVVFINAAYGLGETVVQGAVNPDEFYLFKRNIAEQRPAVLRRSLGSKAIKMVYAHDGVKTVEVPAADRSRFSLNDAELAELARHAMTIENHYGRPMDIEWGKDGQDGKLYILQARPETVKSRDDGQVIERFKLKETGPVLVEGRSIGQRIGTGTVRILDSVKDMHKIGSGDILVTDMTDPDWEPIMKKAAAIVTNRGGRTCHAAIIARELGIPAVVGTGDGTKRLSEGEAVTVSCAQGDTGYVYSGVLDFELQSHRLDQMPDLPLKITMNVGNPDRAFAFASLPHKGVGLARLEFIINQMIGVHPKALLEYDVQSPELRAKIDQHIAGYSDPVEYYVARLTEGIATVAAAFWPQAVIVRLSDFKSNEYFNLLGGDVFEPNEENPMIGFRGAARYLSESFRRCFELECQALKRVRNDLGLSNVEIMVPFVRTLDEARGVSELLTENGLARGDNGLRHIMMCELPSNALLADEFLQYFDGFSIGSNDLTQLTLGLDRDSSLIADKFDERDPAVKALLRMAIQACRRAEKYVGICGQGPSDHPDLARWLLDQGIDSLSLNPDSVVKTWMFIAGQK